MGDRAGSRAKSWNLPSGISSSAREAAPSCRTLTTAAPGCREIAIEGVTALTVPVGDPAALADAMAGLAEDAAMRERFGKAARHLVETEFSADAIGRQTVALFDRLVGR